MRLSRPRKSRCGNGTRAGRRIAATETARTPHLVRCLTTQAAPAETANRHRQDPFDVRTESTLASLFRSVSSQWVPRSDPRRRDSWHLLASKARGERRRHRGRHTTAAGSRLLATRGVALPSPQAPWVPWSIWPPLLRWRGCRSDLRRDAFDLLDDRARYGADRGASISEDVVGPSQNARERPELPRGS